MSEETHGFSVDVLVYFAFPTSDRRWIIRQGTLSTVNGLQQRIVFPGFEVRSTPGAGITATYNIGQNIRRTHTAVICDVTQIVTVNGKVEAKVPQVDGIEV